MTAQILRLDDRRPVPLKRVRRPKQKSQYELYPLPFFNAKERCTWDVKPTGNYAADCDTGRDYAFEFLNSCDRTNGWASLLQHIVVDMIGAGLTGRWADGGPRSNGIVIGFMGTIGKALVEVDRLE
jgi:hypothetical protein